MINDINYCNYLVAKMVVPKFGLASSVGLVTIYNHTQPLQSCLEVPQPLVRIGLKAPFFITDRKGFDRWNFPFLRLETWILDGCCFNEMPGIGWRRWFVQIWRKGMLLRKMTGEILMVEIFLAAEKSTLKAFTGCLRYGCVYIYIYIRIYIFVLWIYSIHVYIWSNYSKLTRSHSKR